MKKNEVKVGGVYQAKVSDRIVPVRIDGTISRGGWNATNTATGKRVIIKSPQRLRGAAKADSKATTKTDAPEANPMVEVDTGQPMPADVKGAKSTAGKKRSAKKATGEPKPKRTSLLDAAYEVLKRHGQPMRTKEIIEAAASAGLWSSPAGKTPWATLDSAIRREIKTRSAAARFAFVERGQFAAKA